MHIVRKSQLDCEEVRAGLTKSREWGGSQEHECYSGRLTGKPHRSEGIPAQRSTGAAIGQQMFVEPKSQIAERAASGLHRTLVSNTVHCSDYTNRYRAQPCERLARTGRMDDTRATARFKQACFFSCGTEQACGET